VFGQGYANAYDALYQDKDYEAECAVIERLFQEHGSGRIRSVLDLGCGTGSHAIPLAHRGYSVTGIDRSEDMIRCAQPKVNGQAVSFLTGDIRTIRLDHEFDAVLMMFAVLGYQKENADVMAALKTARQHIRPGGLFLFDVWYGPAVLRERPTQRVKSIPTAKGQILRIAAGELDTRKHCCTVSYELWEFEGDRLAGKSAEQHTMRYFFPLELELLLGISGFALLRLAAFPAIDREPSEETWNVLGVAIAR
jgi:SAM-dependent methyltransferase